MKQLILIAGAAAFAFAAPVAAKPAHAGQGKGKGQQTRVIPGQSPGLGVGGCPPGHSKHPGMCMPHGQWKKQFEVGQRLPLGTKGLLGYNALPYDLRSSYGSQLDPRSGYLYDNSYLYRVDPTTMVVQQVLNAVLRP